MSQQITVKFTPHDNRIDADFLTLPQALYDTKSIHQNYQEEQQLLAETHPLSHYFSLHRFVAYKGETPVARALVAQYEPGRAFIGYYECVDQPFVAETLFTTIFAEMKRQSVTTLTGPYNASFWIQYRMKLNRFTNRPYMGEPTNKPYYQAQFEAAGFVETHHYVSNEYSRRFDLKTIKEFGRSTKRARRLKYRIVSPRPEDFLSTMGHTYDLFSRLYSDFPGFVPITKEEYIASLRSLKPLLSMPFVKFAYHGDDVVGFIVAFPDYGNLAYRPMTVWNKLRIALRRHRASRYVIMYIGVVPEHSGLSRALIRSIVISAVLRGARVIGALALETKVTAGYAKNRIKKHYTYGLFEKKI